MPNWSINYGCSPNVPSGMKRISSFSFLPPGLGGLVPLLLIICVSCVTWNNHDCVSCVAPTHPNKEKNMLLGVGADRPNPLLCLYIHAGKQVDRQTDYNKRAHRLLFIHMIANLLTNYTRDVQLIVQLPLPPPARSLWDNYDNSSSTDKLLSNSLLALWVAQCRLLLWNHE